ETIKETYRDREVSQVNFRWAILKPTDGIGLIQAVKQRKGRRLQGIEVRAAIGDRVELSYAVHLERLNGILRDRLNCLIRKTHAFAKDTATWDALFGLALFEHNWIRPQIALRLPLPNPHLGRCYDRRTPAMALGFSDHTWFWEELFRLPVERGGGRSRPD